jgi:hypothetical protein
MRRHEPDRRLGLSLGGYYAARGHQGAAHRRRHLAWRPVGAGGAHALARLYAAARLYVNFFQPSFKLKEKRREGAKIIKRYHARETADKVALWIAGGSSRRADRRSSSPIRVIIRTPVCDSRAAWRTDLASTWPLTVLFQHRLEMIGMRGETLPSLPLVQTG